MRPKSTHTICFHLFIILEIKNSDRKETGGCLTVEKAEKGGQGRLLRGIKGSFGNNYMLT